MLAQIGYTYLPPMQKLFHTTPLSVTDWLICLLPGVLLLLIVETEKAFVRRITKANVPKSDM
jgi:hypothetical protein